MSDCLRDRLSPDLAGALAYQVLKALSYSLDIFTLDACSDMAYDMFFSLTVRGGTLLGGIMCPYYVSHYTEITTTTSELYVLGQCLSL